MPAVIAAIAAAVSVLLFVPPRRSALARLAGPAPPARVLQSFGQRAVRARRAAEVVPLIRAIASELRAGAVTADALRAAARESPAWRDEVEASGRALARGADLSSELDRLAGIAGGEALRPLAAVWAAGAAAGAAMASVLDRVADALDAHATARAELHADMEGARATAFLLAMLPLGGLALGQAVGASPIHLLVHRPIGWALAVAAAVLDTCGVLWVRRLARVE